jgi:penicillin amidase
MPRVDLEAPSPRPLFPTASSTAFPCCSRIFSLETGAGGDASTVNVGAYRRDGSFLMTDGASYRQILDLSDFSRSLYVHTTGQSGNVFDSAYRNLLPLWRDGRYVSMGGPAETHAPALEPDKRLPSRD